MAGGLPAWSAIPEGQRQPNLGKLLVALTALGQQTRQAQAATNQAQAATNQAQAATNQAQAATNQPARRPTQTSARPATSSPSSAQRIATPEQAARQGPWLADDASLRKAAVLVPLYEHQGEVHIILTRRAARMRAHSREVSFPGGGMEEGDQSLWHTALREAREEISLPTERVAQVGTLPVFRTFGSMSLVHPYVGVVDIESSGVTAADIKTRAQLNLKPDPKEVERILHVSMSELLAEGVFWEELWQLPDIGPAGPVKVSFFGLEGDTVWGATASILRQLLELATGTHSAVSHHFWEQPRPSG